MKRAVWLAVAAAAWVTWGGLMFASTEHVPATTGLYWAITTATTVGYGDVVPRDSAGRLIAVVVMLGAIPLLGAAFAAATSAHLSSWWHERHATRLDDMHQVLSDLYEHATGQPHPRSTSNHDTSDTPRHPGAAS